MTEETIKMGIEQVEQRIMGKEVYQELLADFKEADWLTGDEISMTVKAYRMMKTKDFDFDEFAKVYESLAKITGRA